MNDDRIKDALMLMALERGRRKTFCPSEVARKLDPDDWRLLMPEIRRVARDIHLRATQRGTLVDPVAAKGPIRLSIGDTMPYKPDTYPDVSAYLIVTNPDAVFSFAQSVFGAIRLREITRDDGSIMHAEMRVGDSVIMIGGADGGPHAHLHLYLEDPDAAFAKALDHGATEVQPMQDQGDGDRRGGVKDPSGTTWWLARQT